MAGQGFLDRAATRITQALQLAVLLEEDAELDQQRKLNWHQRLLEADRIIYEVVTEIAVSVERGKEGGAIMAQITGGAADIATLLKNKKILFRLGEHEAAEILEVIEPEPLLRAWRRLPAKRRAEIRAVIAQADQAKSSSP
jgi:hypothetical protein